MYFKYILIVESVNISFSLVSRRPIIEFDKIKMIRILFIYFQKNEKKWAI